MRRGFCLLLLASFLSGSAHAGYGFSRSLSIDKTKVPNTNQTDFPVLFCFNGSAAPCNNGSLAVANLKTVGNGGKVTNSSGFDIVFGSDPSCSSLLNFEMEFYSATTGEVAAWVKVPTVSTSVNTVVYICYANAAISTFQGNVNGTWNSAFKAVWHYPNGTTLSLTDSTSNGRNGSNGTVAPVADIGKVDGGSSSGTINQGYSTYSDTGLPSGTADRTISAWFGPKSVLTTDPNNYVIFYGKAGTNSQAQGMNLKRTTINGCAAGTADLYVILYVGWNDDYQGTTTFCSQPSVFHYIVLTFTSSGTVARIYIDGAIDASGSAVKGSWNTTLNTTMFVNEADPSVFAGNCSCVVDEARIANVVRSADWIATEYNNQSAPATFYTVGAEVPIGAKLLLLGVG